jgi:Asp/Glu/hydantoin racemase
MLRQLGLIHTAHMLVPIFTDLARRHLPEWETFHIVDDSLLRNTIRAGELESATSRRLTQYVWSAADAGAEAVMVTCSSMGPAVDAGMALSPVSLFRIDEAMAEAALAIGGRIAVLATLATTLGPTRDLIERKVRLAGLSTIITHSVCTSAFEALQNGDRDRHDAIVLAELRKAAAAADVVVLAQASMARVLDGLPPDALPTPVLSSPELGMKNLAHVLGTSVEPSKRPSPAA